MSRTRPSTLGPLQRARRLPARKDTSGDLGALAPHERDAVAFWFRRLSTTLAIGNGAGVIAIGSFISSNRDNLETVAASAYASLSLFLSGAVSAFICFVITLFWSVFRIDAYSEHFARLEKLKFVFDSGQDQIRNAITVSATILALAQLGAIIFGAAYFYLGALNVVESLRLTACAKDKSDFCNHGASIIFPAISTYASMSKPLLGQNESAPTNSASPGITVREIKRPIGSPDSATYPIAAYVDASAENELVELRASLAVRVDIVPDGGKASSCVFDMTDYFIGNTSPLVRNPYIEDFLLLDGVSGEGYTVLVNPISTMITIIVRSRTPHTSKELLYPVDEPNKPRITDITAVEIDSSTGRVRKVDVEVRRRHSLITYKYSPSGVMAFRGVIGNYSKECDHVIERLRISRPSSQPRLVPRD